MADTKYSKFNRVVERVRLSVLYYLKGYAAAVTSLGGLSSGATAFINATVAGSPALTAVFGVAAVVFAVANPIFVVIARNITPEKLAQLEAALDAGDVGAVADQLVDIVNEFSDIHPDAKVLDVFDNVAAGMRGQDGLGVQRVVEQVGTSYKTGEAEPQYETFYVVDQNGMDGEER